VKKIESDKLKELVRGNMQQWKCTKENHLDALQRGNIYQSSLQGICYSRMRENEKKDM